MGVAVTTRISRFLNGSFASCAGIACIVGIVYMIQGKKKGLKMVGISIMFTILWNVINVIIQAALHAPHQGFR